MTVDIGIVALILYLVRQKFDFTSKENQYFETFAAWLFVAALLEFVCTFFMLVGNYTKRPYLFWPYLLNVVSINKLYQY